MKEPVEFLSGKSKHATRRARTNQSKAKSPNVQVTKEAINKVKFEKSVALTASQRNTIQYLQLGASISLIALIFLCLAWETVLAPLKPQGSWLTLKAAFLCIPLLGILKGRRYTYQWACMFILFYFIEGCVRAWADVGISAKLALFEVLLTTVFFFCAIYYAKLSAKLTTKPANS